VGGRETLVVCGGKIKEEVARVDGTSVVELKKEGEDVHGHFFSNSDGSKGKR